jgi:CBS domain-containing protein
MTNLINPNLKFAHATDKVKSVVEKMIADRISSVLVVNDGHEVVGILTERDIVHKFTLIEDADKLSTQAESIMSSPVHFVRATDLEEDIEKLHRQFKIRHFPVVAGKTFKRDDVLGMVTVTDLSKAFLQGKIKGKGEKRTNQICFIHGRNSYANGLNKLFVTMGYQIIENHDWHDTIEAAKAAKLPICFDLDGFDATTAAEIIKALKSLDVLTAILVSEPKLIEPFRTKLSKEKHTLLKPIDFSYLNWLFAGNFDQA